jgi:hypothetical protein
MTGKVHFEGKEKPKDAFAKGEVHEELTLIKDHAHGANGRCAQDRPLVRIMMTCDGLGSVGCGSVCVCVRGALGGGVRGGIHRPNQRGYGIIRR